MLRNPESSMTLTFRRMFPTLKIKVTGLNPKEEYDIRCERNIETANDVISFSLELKSIDNKRYRYVYHR